MHNIIHYRGKAFAERYLRAYAVCKQENSPSNESKENATGKWHMITLKRLNGKEFVLNAEFIETLEATPDTIIKLKTGKTIVVQDPIDDIIRRTIEYKRLCNQSIAIVNRKLDSDESCSF